MTTLINGDIYIKIKPSIFNPTDEEIQEVENKKYDIDFKEAHTGATGGTQEIKRILNSMSDIFKASGQTDYSYLDEFHILETNGQTVTMNIYERVLGKKIQKTFDIESEQMTQYMSLTDFLKEAEFVGKEIKIYNDPLLKDPTVIYKTDYAMCVQTEKPLGGQYIKMLDIRLLNKPLGETDETVEQYRNKKLLYKTIVQQIDELSKICDKPDEHRRQK